MTQASSHNFANASSLNNSRLIRFLSEISISKIEVTNKHFAEKLGRLIDLSDSVTLSESLRGLPRLRFESGNTQISDIQEDFLLQRSAIVTSIASSFLASPGKVRFKLPRPKVTASIGEATDFAVYQRFYAVHQSEMASKIQILRIDLRQSVAGVSAELAQLAEVDKALGNCLSVHTRNFFAVVPKLLKVRFDYLYDEHKNSAKVDEPVENWLQPAAWLDKFYSEMQQFLLAELEVRLQPLLGLVEALNEEVSKSK